MKLNILISFPLCGCLFLGTFMQSAAQQKSPVISSPNKKVRVEVQVNSSISYSVFFNSEEIISPSQISMKLADGMQMGKNPNLKNVKTRSVNETISSPVPEKRRIIPDKYNEMTLNFDNNFDLIFRAYDDGVAYRFVTHFNNQIEIADEQVSFNFPNDRSVFIPFEESFITHSERLYPYMKISEIATEQMACVPVLIYDETRPILAITEADLEDYPGLYIKRNPDGFGFTGLFPALALGEKQTRDRTVIVSKRADAIAKTEGSREFPWRVIMIAENDKDLLTNDIIYRLGKPLQIKDPSWIKPGKVAWDWWNAINLYGVDFKSGVNTASYKYFIDFASENNIEYVIFDEGWSAPSDLFKINPDMDMDELMDYAAQKNVGIILWCVWLTLENQFEQAFDQFEKWGVKGIKVDFMQRDDQKMVNYYQRVTEEAARRKLLVDFHGAYKPTGLRRAYPNLITREGVRGLEHSKWSKDITPEHDVTLPFTRMLAGPMDFTPGAMINATEKNFNPVFEKPMSQGTRCHQLAMFVIYESPLQMLCDSPSNYKREPETMKFLSTVPTTWDETVVLDAKVADYVLMARKHGNEWYIGAMTDWTPRNFTIDFSFLDGGNYTAEIYQDGINANRYASDFKHVTKQVTATDKMEIKLAPGGGWVARIHQE